MFWENIEGETLKPHEECPDINFGLVPDIETDHVEIDLGEED